MTGFNNPSDNRSPWLHATATTTQLDPPTPRKSAPQPQIVASETHTQQGFADLPKSPPPNSFRQVKQSAISPSVSAQASQGRTAFSHRSQSFENSAIGCRTAISGAPDSPFKRFSHELGEEIGPPAPPRVASLQSPVMKRAVGKLNMQLPHYATFEFEQGGVNKLDMEQQQAMQLNAQIQMQMQLTSLGMHGIDQSEFTTGVVDAYNIFMPAETQPTHFGFNDRQRSSGGGAGGGGGGGTSNNNHNNSSSSGNNPSHYSPVIYHKDAKRLSMDQSSGMGLGPQHSVKHRIEVPIDSPPGVNIGASPGNPGQRETPKHTFANSFDGIAAARKESAGGGGGGDRDVPLRQQSNSYFQDQRMQQPQVSSYQGSSRSIGKCRLNTISSILYH